MNGSTSHGVVQPCW